ncbi:MAG: hypothetical protein GXX79_19730 [Actinomycetales bacterium]|nr:hypothetical protein [Actinomycetales bacterium]
MCFAHLAEGTRGGRGAGVVLADGTRGDGVTIGLRDATWTAAVRCSRSAPWQG